MTFGKPTIKLGLLVVIIFEIVCLFYFLYVYKKVTTNANNYYTELLKSDPSEGVLETIKNN